MNDLSAGAASGDGERRIHAGRLIDVIDGEVLEARTIVIADGRAVTL